MRHMNRIAYLLAGWCVIDSSYAVACSVRIEPPSETLHFTLLFIFLIYTLFIATFMILKRKILTIPRLVLLLGLFGILGAAVVIIRTPTTIDEQICGRWKHFNSLSCHCSY